MPLLKKPAPKKNPALLKRIKSFLRKKTRLGEYDKKPFPGSMGAGVDAIRKRKERMRIVEKQMGM